jgi:hypothetical protein
MHSSLKFAGILRIAAAAVTPSIILIAASIALQQTIPGLIYVVVTLLYLMVGIRVCAKPAEEEQIPKLKLSGLLEEDSGNQQSHAA